MAPKSFFFVNKTAKSRCFTRPDANETTDVSRHVQEQIQATRRRQRRLVGDSRELTLYPSTLEIIKSASALGRAQATERTWRLHRVDTWSKTHVIDADETSIEQGHDLNCDARKNEGLVDARSQSYLAGRRSSSFSLVQVHHDDLNQYSKDSVWEAPGSTLKFLTLQRSICGENGNIDPFARTSVPITSTVHNMLIYFESLWFPTL